jgi:putative protease
VGDRVEIMRPHGEDAVVEVLAMRDENGTPIESCPHPKQRIEVKFQERPDVMDIIRVKCE